MANPTVTRSSRHVRGRPCPVCSGWDEVERGQGKRCSGFTTEDGSYCNCSRDEYAGSISPNAAGLYGHKMRGSCKCGTTHGSAIIDTGPRIVATYDYCDEAGDLLYQQVRMHPKTFRTRRQDASKPGGWDWSIGDTRRVPYLLPALLAADPSATVYVVDGEKDVHTLRNMGLVATCNSHGNPGAKRCDWSVLTGRRVVIVADADDPGRKAAIEIGRIVPGATILECTKGKDVSDHLAAGGTLEELVPMATMPAEAVSKVQARAPTLRLVDGPAWGDEEPPGPQEDKRPEIVVSSDVHGMVVELEARMAELDDGLFHRAGELVIAVPNRRAGVGEGAPVIHVVTKPLVLERITKHVQFVRIEDAGEKACARAHAAGEPPPKPDRTRCAPPDTLVVAPFVSRRAWANIRHLIGITETPTLRPNGSICQSAGYDSETGYLYMPSFDYPKVADSPTQADAIGALAQLFDVFSDFPYDAEPSKLVPVAALLSILARPAIKGGIPAFLFDASVRGSGKTLQCDVVHLIATGRVAPHATWSQDDEEQRKVINGFAELAPRAIVFDNVKGVFGGQHAEAALTSDVIQGRQLGSRSIVEYPWTTVLMVSGNNLQLTDDMLRRSLLSRLETPLERPEDRPDTEFSHPDLLEWVRAERPRLVVAALTILRAYAVKAFPDTGVRMASYQSWARIVAGALMFARGGDVTKARPSEERAAVEDVTYARTIAMRLGEWSTPKGTIKQILQSLWPNLEHGEQRAPDGFEDLREAFEGIAPSKFTGQMPNPVIVGKRLRAYKGRWFGDHKIESKVDRKGTSEWWSVKK